MFCVTRKHFELDNNKTKFMVSKELFDLYTDMTFDKNTGDTIEYQNARLKIGSKFTEFPTATKADNRLLGYSYSPIAGSQILTDNDTVDCINKTAYAQWLQLINQTFDADIGRFPDSSQTKTLKYAPGYAFSEYGLPSNPTHTTKTFGGWFTRREGMGTKITEASICPNSQTTYYAYWRDSLGTMVFAGYYGDYEETEIELGEITSYDSESRAVTVKCNGSEYIDGFSGTVTFYFEEQYVSNGDGYQWENYGSFMLNWYGVEDCGFDIYVKMKGLQ